jgi:hypothetical protein
MNEINISLQEGAIDTVDAMSELELLDKMRQSYHQPDKSKTELSLFETPKDNDTYLSEFSSGEFEESDFSNDLLTPTSQPSKQIPKMMLINCRTPSQQRNIIKGITINSSSTQVQDSTQISDKTNQGFINFTVDLTMQMTAHWIEQTMFDSSISAGLLPFYKNSNIILDPPSSPLEHRFTPRMFFSAEEVMPPILAHETVKSSLPSNFTTENSASYEQLNLAMESERQPCFLSTSLVTKHPLKPPETKKFSSQSITPPSSSLDSTPSPDFSHQVLFPISSYNGFLRTPQKKRKLRSYTSDPESKRKRRLRK